MVEVTRATREKSKLRIALAGVSGGGKTLVPCCWPPA